MISFMLPALLELMERTILDEGEISQPDAPEEGSKSYCSMSYGGVPQGYVQIGEKRWIDRAEAFAVVTVVLAAQSVLHLS